MDQLNKISDKLITPFIEDCERETATKVNEFVKENHKLPSLIDCMEEIEFHNTQVIDQMIEMFMAHGEGYTMCTGPANTWDDCSRCDSFSACYQSIMHSNIMPYHREVFEDVSLTSLVFGSLRYSGVSIFIDAPCHKLYGDFVDCFDNDNQVILDNMYFTSNDQVVYANHAQMTMFDGLFMDTPGSVFRFGSNAAIIYDSFNHKYRSFYLEQEDDHVLIE